MDPRTSPAAPRRYGIFHPQTNLVAEQGAITFLVYLPEFKKEQLRVQLSSSRVLRISGESDEKWRQFQKEIRVPEECNTKGIVAKFDGSILYVKQPIKLVSPAAEPPQINNDIAEKLEEEEPIKDIVEDPHQRKCVVAENLDSRMKSEGDVCVMTDVRKTKQITDISEKITKNTQIYVVHQRCVGYIHGQTDIRLYFREETDYKTHKKRSKSKNTLSCYL